MLFGMVQGGEGGENERCEVTRWSGDGMNRRPIALRPSTSLVI